MAKIKKDEKLKWYKEEFDRIKESLENESKDQLSLLDFLKIRNFKMQIMTTATEEEVAEHTKKAFEKAKKEIGGEGRIKDVIATLEGGLTGVGFPIASAILAMRFPDKYCIIDWRVISQLNHRGLLKNDVRDDWLKKYQKSELVYEEYLTRMREKAGEGKVNLRKFELELFEENIKMGEKKKDIENNG